MRQRSDSRVLAAVLFTDIVNSSALASRVGDGRWKELIARHHGIVRRELKRFGGRELDTAGDGFYASFAGPAAAIRCACAIADAVRTLGIEIRAGVHFGECEQQKEKLGGIAVVVGARVMSLAGPGEVLVTSSTSALVAGAGLGFTERGEHSLKGVDGEWRLLAVSEVDGERELRRPTWRRLQRRMAEIHAPLSLSGRRLPSLRWVIGIAAVLAAALVAISIPLVRGGHEPLDIGTNSIGRINSGSGGVDLVTALGQRPGASAIGSGSLWVAEPDRGVVARLSLKDGSVIDPSIRVGSSPSGVAVGGGSVWVANAGDGTVSRIDPGTNEVSQTLRDVGTQPSGIAFGAGALWVTDSIGAELVEVDAASGRSQHVRLAGQPSGVAFTSRGVWLRSPLPGSPGSIPGTSASSSATRTWATDRRPWLPPSARSGSRTTPTGPSPVSTRRPDSSRRQSRSGTGRMHSERAPAPCGSPTSSAARSARSTRRRAPSGGQSRWAARRHPWRPILMGLWLAVGASATEHRGGTLTVSSERASFFGGRQLTSLDPAVVYDPVRLADPVDHKRRTTGIQEGRRPGRSDTCPGPGVGASPGVRRRTHLSLPVAGRDPVLERGRCSPRGLPARPGAIPLLELRIPAVLRRDRRRPGVRRRPVDVRPVHRSSPMTRP